MELKPCPFCGGQTILIEQDGHAKFRLACSTCHVFLARRYKPGEADEAYQNLLGRWNRRVTDRTD